MFKQSCLPACCPRSTVSANNRAEISCHGDIAERFDRCGRLRAFVTLRDHSVVGRIGIGERIAEHGMNGFVATQFAEPDGVCGSMEHRNETYAAAYS